MTETPKVAETLTAELTEFTIHTTPREILTKRSVFNPFPEQATQGMQVWSTHHEMAIVRYQETGNMYLVDIPDSHGAEEFPKPESLTEDPLLASPLGRWMNVDSFLTPDIIRNTESDGFEGSLPLFYESVVKRFVTLKDGSQIPVFEDPEVARTKILQNAKKLLDKSLWREAVCLALEDNSLGEFKINGQKYSGNRCRITFNDYHLALEAIPTLRKDVLKESRLGPIEQNIQTHFTDFRGDSTYEKSTLLQIEHLSWRIAIFLRDSLELQALEIALQEFKDSPGAQERLTTVLGQLRRTVSKTREELAKSESSDGTSYFDQIEQYLAANGLTYLLETTSRS